VIEWRVIQHCKDHLSPCHQGTVNEYVTHLRNTVARSVCKWWSKDKVTFILSLGATTCYEICVPIMAYMLVWMCRYVVYNLSRHYCHKGLSCVVVICKEKIVNKIVHQKQFKIQQSKSPCLFLSYAFKDPVTTIIQGPCGTLWDLNASINRVVSHTHMSVAVLHTHAHPSYSLNHFLEFQCAWHCVKSA
jgi:hypothetical protein